MQIEPGEYRHYKGPRYWVCQCATHSETGEPLVVYRCLYGDYSWWVRPAAMFTELVVVDGVSRPRFQRVGTMSYADAEREANG
ncbi:MAG TPA: DUF1653 domain-containing protein [Cellvibrionaceae bacterium]